MHFRCGYCSSINSSVCCQYVPLLLLLLVQQLLVLVLQLLLLLLVLLLLVLEHYITATRFFGHSFIANMYQFVFYTDDIIYSDCAPYTAGILHVMWCAQWLLRRNSPSKINWTECPFSTYIVVVFFPHEIRMGCARPRY